MKLSPEEIKKWNDAVSTLTAICNHHCTEKGCCEGCPFDALRFHDASGERSWCPIGAAVLYEGAHRVRIEDFIQTELCPELHPAERREVVVSCKNCQNRQDDGMCTIRQFRPLYPGHKLCDQWEPRADILKGNQI
jgi:Fe-S-cluster-containing hydrogenase component 2